MSLPDDGTWVVGNNWLIQHLTGAERAYLDAHPCVFALNHFGSKWHHIGFRPSHIVFGDTCGAANRRALHAELRAIAHDDALLAHLSAIFVGDPGPEHFIHHGPDGKREEFIPFGHHLRRSFPALATRLNAYRRGPARRLHQRIARHWFARIYHYASTITDAVNMAALYRPGEPVRVLGNPFGIPYGYFYADERADQAQFLTNIWAGLRRLRDGGIDVRDANLFHGADIPEEFRLPRELWWSASR